MLSSIANANAASRYSTAAIGANQLHSVTQRRRQKTKVQKCSHKISMMRPYAGGGGLGEDAAAEKEGLRSLLLAWVRSCCVSSHIPLVSRARRGNERDGRGLRRFREGAEPRGRYRFSFSSLCLFESSFRYARQLVIVHLLCRSCPAANTSAVLA